jgi:hypothetical protein
MSHSSFKKHVLQGISTMEYKMRGMWQNILFLLIFSFFVANVFASQTVSPLYGQIVNGDEKAVVSFLKKTKMLPEYQSLFATQLNIYGVDLQNEVYSEEKKRQYMITHLEPLLQKNPKSRDVLYTLSMLYRQEGNVQMAEKYRILAEEVDPMVGK